MIAAVLFVSMLGVAQNEVFYRFAPPKNTRDFLRAGVNAVVGALAFAAIICSVSHMPGSMVLLRVLVACIPLVAPLHIAPQIARTLARR